MRVWTKVTALLPALPEDWAVYAEAFDRHGIPGTVQTDRPATISGYAFEPAPDDLASLRSLLIERGATDVAVESIEEEDWAEGWKQFFKPRRVGRRLIVVPSWEPVEVAEDEIPIILDPGQAFGTGDHPTTRLCLEPLENADVQGACVADIGCGSGILSIAALKLGASSVEAVDVERAAVESARANAERNGVEFDVHEGRGFEPLVSRDPEALYDLVLSNIISAALIHLAPSTAERVRPGGAWIVSGVIDANWEDVLNAALEAGFSYESIKREDGWLAASFRR